MVSVALTANGNRIRHDILRQGHTRHAGVTDVVDIRTDHLAHQRNLTESWRCPAPFLRSSDGCQRQFTVCVYFRSIMGIVLCVMPGTVPGAGSRMISAPAAIKGLGVGGGHDFSPPSPATPEACILPAASITRSPTAAEISFNDSTINSLLTPLPGLPVSTISQRPYRRRGWRFLPWQGGRCSSSTAYHRCFWWPRGRMAPGLMPMTRPVRRFESRDQLWPREPSARR